MTIDAKDLLNSILSSLSRIDYIRPESIPNIDLYPPIRYCMYRIGGRRRGQDASLVGVAVGIPPLWYWISNQPP